MAVESIYEKRYTKYSRGDLTAVKLVDTLYQGMSVTLGGVTATSNAEHLGVLLEDGVGDDLRDIVSRDSSTVYAKINEEQDITIGMLLSVDATGLFVEGTAGDLAVAMAIEDVSTGTDETALIPVQLGRWLVPEPPPGP